MKLWHLVPFGQFPTEVDHELQGVVLEADPDTGRVLEVSLQFFVKVGRLRPMQWHFGRRETLARPMLWLRAFWSRPDEHSTLRVRLGLGVVAIRCGVCPHVVYL